VRLVQQSGGGNGGARIAVPQDRARTGLSLTLAPRRRPELGVAARARKAGGNVLMTA
jgi:hypothetical protein